MRAAIQQIVPPAGRASLSHRSLVAFHHLARETAHVFTGLIQHVGKVQSIARHGGAARLVIDAQNWNHIPTHGASISVNGCCLSIADTSQPGKLLFDVIAQTLKVTTLGDLQAGHSVNLEHAVMPTTLLGGHIVQGHVDGIGVVLHVTDAPGERRLRIQPPAHLMDVIVDKGSIAMDGVSLTVAALLENAFEVALIPTTLRETTLGNLEPGSRVNLEADYVAKTVVHWLQRQDLSKLTGR